MLADRPVAPLGVALLALASLLGSEVSAQEADAVQLTVRGVSGRKLVAKRRHFMAVNVVLDNPSGRDSQGTLRVYRSRNPNEVTPDQSLFYERQVEVPGGGRRVETLYYYCQESEPKNQLCVQYEPVDGPPSLPVFPQFEVLLNEQQILLLSSRPQAADAYARPLQAALVPGARRTLPVQVQRGDLGALPSHLAGYDPFDVVLIADLDAADLPEDRAQPLLDWVSAGGDLIVSFSGGRGELPPLLKRVLPVAPLAGSANKRQLTALRSMAPGAGLIARQPVLVDRIEALSSAEVLAGDAQGPLVVRGRHGAGYVTYVAFPLDAGPLRTWTSGKATFARNLLRLPRQELEPPNDVPTLPPVEELLLNLSEALETLEPPSALIVAPLLLLYVALVSPLNFLVLSRMKRLGLAQVTAGIVALVFGFLFFSIGYLFKGSDALVTQIALVEVPTQPGGSRLEVMTGYFSTDRGLSQALCPPNSVVGPIANQSTSREGRVVQSEDGVRLESLTLDTWALRRFRSLRVEDLGHVELELSLDRRPDKLVGQVTNRTRYTLDTPMLLLNNGYLQLSTMEPGAALRLSNSVSWIGRENPRLELLKGLFADAGRRYPGRYGEGFVSGSDPYSGSAERRILATLRGRLLRVPHAPGKVPALLVARVSEDPGGLIVAGDARATLSRMIVMCEVQVDVPSGPHTLKGQAPVITGAIEGLWEPHGGRTGSAPILKGIATSLSADKPGIVQFEWRLPASPEAPLLLDNLKIRWRVSPRPVPFGQTLRAWDFRTGRWIDLYEDMVKAKLDGRNSGKWPPEEVNPLVHHIVDPTTGTVRVRLLNKAQNLSVEQMVLDVSFRR